jgi:hypothetical protein
MFRFGCSRMDGVSVTAERDWITPSLPERCEDWPLERSWYPWCRKSVDGKMRSASR